MNKIIIFGAGKLGIEFLRKIGTENVYCFLDNNPDIHNHEIDGIKVLNIQDIKKFVEEYIVVICMTKPKQNIIIDQLEENNIFDYLPYSELLKIDKEKWKIVFNNKTQRQNLRYNYTKNRIDTLSTQINYFKRHIDIKNIKPAMGQLRKQQLDEVELAKTFAKAMEPLKIKLILYGGNLLGYVRHNGFIPWDDDIDFLLFRKDYECLRNYFKDNGTNDIKDNECSWTLDGWRFYERDNYFCIGNEESKYIIDIFSIDYYDDEYSFLEFRKEAERINRKKLKLDSIPDKVKYIRKVINESKYIVEKSNSLYWGLDNMDAYMQYNKGEWIPENLILPLKKALFEGMEVFVPNNPEKFVEYMYRECFSFPDDVGLLPHYSIDDVY